MNLRDEENRLVLQAWVSDMRASAEKVSRGSAISIPKNPGEALARLKQESELNAPAVEQAVFCFSRKSYWPVTLGNSERYYINLRVLAACRIIDSILSGDLTDPGIIRAISEDKLNFTEWMLTSGWGLFGEWYLKWLAEAQSNYPCGLGPSL